MTDCDFRKFNAKKDCQKKNGIPTGRLSAAALLRFHPDRVSASCKSKANKKFIDTTSACKKQIGSVDIRASEENISALFDGTILGPKGLLASTFAYKVNVPTFAEAKDNIAAAKKSKKLPAAKNGIKKFDNIIKGVYKAKTPVDALKVILLKKSVQK